MVRGTTVVKNSYLQNLHVVSLISFRKSLYMPKINHDCHLEPGVRGCRGLVKPYKARFCSRASSKSSRPTSAKKAGKALGIATLPYKGMLMLAYAAGPDATISLPAPCISARMSHDKRERARLREASADVREIHAPIDEAYKLLVAAAFLHKAFGD